MKLRLLGLILVATTAWAEDLYVTPTGGGTHDGSSWTNAFPGLAAVSWGAGSGKVGPGDTLWVAGGTYTSFLTIGASGTAGSRIQVRRVKSTDAVPVAADGWNPAFDSQAVIDGSLPTSILFTGGVGSYVTIDGREEYGIKCMLKDGATGVEIDNTPGTITDITLQYIEVAGPGPITQTSDTRAFDLTISGIIANLHVSHCAGHHCDTVFQLTPNTGLIVEYCRFYDAYAVNASTFHPNTMILNDTVDATIRFNRLYNIRVEGLFFESGNSNNVDIYGNLFYVGDVPPDNGRGIEFGTTVNATNFRIYNNTFVGLPFRGLRLSGASHAGTLVRNNIFYNTVAELDNVSHDYNLFSGPFPANEAHGIANAPDPFVNLAANDFHLVSATGATRARNSGEDLGAPLDVDFDGHVRGDDGTWDVGAFEYTEGNGLPTITSDHAAAGGYRSPFTYTIAASESPSSYSLSGTLPAGLTFVPGTATISGTPTAAGVFDVTVRATNAGGTGAAILTLTIDPALLSVTGITANNKVYDGAATATLNSGGAALQGVVAGDTVILLSGSATGSFANANAANGKSVAVTGLQLSGANSGNYLLIPPVLSANIARAPIAVTLGNFVHAFDGTPKSVSVATTPGGVATSVTYSGSTTPPTAAGTYAIVATVTDPNYQGSSTGVLNIMGVVPPVPSITSTGSATATVGAPFAYFITATQSPTSYGASGLPAGLVIDTTTGRITGTPTAPVATTVTLSATNAGGTTNLSLALTIVAGGPVGQTVFFPAPTGAVTIGQPVALSANATSGLAVTYSLVSGNAILIGNSLTVFDTNGVVVRATQPGNASVNRSSADLSLVNVQSLTEDQIYFGLFGIGEMAAATSPDNRRGMLFARDPETGGALSLPLTMDSAGNFSAVTVAGLPPPADAHIAASPQTRTIRGRVWNGLLSGLVEETGTRFSATVQPPDGTTQSLAGVYTAAITASASGTTYVILGTKGQAYVLSNTAALVAAGLGTVDASGAFTVRASNTTTITGTASASSTLITGTIRIADQPAAEFAGGGIRTPSTDRLVNISSRARIDGVRNGDPLVAGFAITGPSPRQVLLRAVGPGLLDYGVQAGLANPRLRLFDHNRQLMAENEDWSDNATTRAATVRVGAFALKSGSRDAVLLATLAPGVYTMHVEANGGAGVALAEVYDAGESGGVEARIVTNISSRGFVDTGEGVMISGLVVGGNVPARVLVRGIGPGLAAYGVGDFLVDPVLKLYRDSTLLAQNDDWGLPQTTNAVQSAASGTEIAAAAASVGAFPLPPGSKDSALVIALAPGAYTAVLSGAGNSIGTGLIEVYQLPNP